MEPTTALFPLCTHTKPDGNRCASPALKGMNFCFQHIGGNLSAMTRARATTSSPGARLNFAYPGDRQAIQHNLSLVAQALSDGKIDTVMANTYNRIYRTCEQNLHRWEKAQQKAGSEEKQMRPLSDEAPESNQQDGAPLQPDGASLQSDGGPLKPAFGLSGEHSTTAGAGAWNEHSNQEPEPASPSDGGPLKPAFGLSGEQESEFPSASSMENPRQDDPKPDVSTEQAPDRSVSGHGLSHAETSPQNNPASAPPDGGPLKPAFGLSGEQAPPDDPYADLRHRALTR